jgi:hypothetical protein
MDCERDRPNRRLRANASGYARIAIDNIRREFPSDVHTLMRAPGDIPYRPRDRTPVFFGSFDWHSASRCTGRWSRLLKAGLGPAAEIRACLDDQFTEDGPARRGGVHGPPVPRRQAAAVRLGLGAVPRVRTGHLGRPGRPALVGAPAPAGRRGHRQLPALFPKATHPVRYGVHPNSAFGLSRAVGIRADPPRAPAGIEALAQRWFAGDADYPAGWEPSGADFLSPALAEAE